MAKEVTLSNIEVINSLGAIQRLIQTSDSLPIGLSIACHDNIETLQDYSGELDDHKESLLDEYAEFDEDGNIKTVDTSENGEPEDMGREEIKFKSDEDRQNYIDELNEKYDEEVELELKTVSQDLVNNIEVPPQVAISLSWMFE